jgi:hypothetical protein
MSNLRSRLLNVAVFSANGAGVGLGSLGETVGVLGGRGAAVLGAGDSVELGDGLGAMLPFGLGEAAVRAATGA